MPMSTALFSKMSHEKRHFDVAQIILNLLTPFLSVLALTLLRGWRIAVVVGVFHGAQRWDEVAVWIHV